MIDRQTVICRQLIPPVENRDTNQNYFAEFPLLSESLQRSVNDGYRICQIYPLPPLQDSAGEMLPVETAGLVIWMERLVRLD